MGISIDTGSNWGGYTPSEFKADVSSLANNVKESFSDGIQSAKEKYNTAVTTVVDIKEDIETKFENGFKTVSNAFTTAASTLKDQTSNFVSGTKTLLGEVKTALGEFGNWAEGAGEKVAEFSKDAYEWVTTKENWEKVGAKIESGVQFVGEKIDAAVEWVTTKENWEKIGAKIESGVTTAVEWAKDPENWKKVWKWVTTKENWEKVGATVATTVASVLTGIGDLGEKIVDGVTWCGAKITEGVTFVAAKVLDAYGHGEAAENVMNWREKMKTDVADFIATDHVKDVEAKFFENTEIGQKINDASYLKYDSKVAQGISSVTEKVAEFAAATAITVATGGAGVGSFAAVFGAGFLAGVGGSAEKNYSEIKEAGGQPSLDDKAANILFDGIGSGLSWYAQGQMGKGAVEAMQAVSQVGGTAFKNQMLNGIKEGFANFKSMSAKERAAAIFSKGNFLSIDNLADSGGVVADNIAAWINGDKELNWKTILGAGVELVGTMGLNCITGGIMGQVNKADDVVDSVKHMDDVDVKKLQSEYDDLLKQRDQEWYKFSKEATENGWAQNLNDAVKADKIDDRIKEIEDTLRDNNTMFTGDKIVDYNSKKMSSEIEISSTADIGSRIRYYQGKNKSIDNFFSSKNRAVYQHIDPVSQRNIVKNINAQVAQNGSAVLSVRHTTDLTSDMLREIDDLSSVQVQIYGGFADLDGNFKLKYQKSGYIDRMTYSGPEALSIVDRIEQLELRIDKSLPVDQRAKQIYDVLSSEIPPMWDYKDYGDVGHKVSASLRGLTSNNPVGKEGLVCAGYATAYKELCERCGIQCDYVRGIGIVNPLGGSKPGPHAWNVVIDGDDIIPVDVTWKASMGRECYGADEMFQMSHIPDDNETFKIYNQVSSKSASRFEVQNSNINDSIQAAISTMDTKYGPGDGLERLRKYAATGDITKITRTNGARESIMNIPIDDIKQYLQAADQTKISGVAELMKGKYGSSEAVARLKNLTQTGNYDIITRDGNARDIMKSISMDQIKHYVEVNDTLDFIKNTMYQKYGNNGIATFEAFLQTGDLIKITNTNGARQLAASLSIADIKGYIGV